MSDSHLLPLVVDLDGTLLRTDLLHESAFALLRRSPIDVLRIPLWLSAGRAALKAEIASRVEIDPAILPYNEPFLEWLKAQKARGRQLVLATASDIRLARPVADHLGLFGQVIASDGTANLSAKAKQRRLEAEFGSSGYCYAGNARADLPVWDSAAAAVVVNAPAAVARAAAQCTPIEHTVPPAPAQLRDWAAALRLHQWLKNMLLFLPLLAAHVYQAPNAWAAAVVGFFAFGLVASSVYLLNDLLDLADDRHHRSKRRRPFASGRIPLWQGAVAAPLLLVAGAATAALLPWRFTAVLAGYYLLTLAYSLWLKREVVIDVVTLATLYTLRIVAGAVAVKVLLSFWLLAFSMFLFLSLALLKRYSELVELRRIGLLAQSRGRGYRVDDLSMLAPLGAAAGYASVLVLALYINSETVADLYREPRAIWLACPLLLYWISRAWIIAHRGEMHDDPVVYAVRDRASRSVALLLAIAFWLAL